MENDSGPLCSTLLRTLQHGIAYHHSGLTSDERRHLEDAFRQNIICVICCTSTLAAGVNLPAKRVILRSPYIGRDFITLSKYKQMVGRAGRAGMGDMGESIIICAPKDNVRVASLLGSPMDEAASSMHLDESRGIRNLMISAIGLGMAVCRTDLQKLISRTLMAVQAERLNINANELTDKMIEHLFKVKAVSVVEPTTSMMNSSNTSLLFESQLNQHASDANSSIENAHHASKMNKSSSSGGGDVVATKKKAVKNTTRNIILKPSTQLEISKLGKAAFKSCIDLAKAQIVYKDLVQAQSSLVLLDYLHLLYIVTPYAPAEINVYPNMQIYYTQVNMN